MTDEGATDNQTATAQPTDQQSVAQTVDAEQPSEQSATSDDRPKPYPHDGKGEGPRPSPGPEADDTADDHTSATDADASTGDSADADDSADDSANADDSSDDSSDADDSTSSSDDSSEDEDDRDLSEVPVDELPEPEKPDVPGYGEDDEQGYVDRDAIDFDPEEGLYSGTAVHGGESELPDPPSDDHVKAAMEDIKSGGDGLVDEEGNKVKNRQDADGDEDDD